MDIFNYLTRSERNQVSRNDDIDWVVNYPCCSPRIVRVENNAPYINPATNTWWQWNAELNQYVDTYMSSNVDPENLEQILEDILPNINISLLNNDIEYATSDEDEPLTLAEVDDILK